MLKIALPNKGSLSSPAMDMLVEAGYRRRRDDRQLVMVDEANDVEFFFLRPRDVAVYVGSSQVDVGITGRDLALDSGTAAVEHLALGFARSTFRYAAPTGTVTRVADIAGKRVASSYPGLVRLHLAGEGITPTAVVRLDGAVESSVQLGVADVVADVVETGSTLKAAGLEVFGEPILRSEAVLLRRPVGVAGGDGDTEAAIAVLTRRLQGVLTARRYVLLDYVVSTASLEAAVAVAPGFESPTISSLVEDGWSAVRVMIERATLNCTMDALYEVGARGILATQILASRL